MSSQTINSTDILENGLMSDPLSDNDLSCSNCELKFDKRADLELHCQLHDKNKDYKCSLCDDVFTDLEQLKLHDLRHSLEEAEEDVTDIEQMILPFGLKLCGICGEKFSCDEELINHSVQHPEVSNLDENLSSDEELMNNPESNDSEDGQINYPILRQEIVKDMSGRTDVRFILIDHQNEQVEEYTHTIHNRVANKKKTQRKNIKRNGNIGKSKNIKKPKTAKKRIKSDDDDVIVQSDDDDEVSFIKSKDVSEHIKSKDINKRIKREGDVMIKDVKSEDDASVKDIKSEDDDIIFEGEGLNSKSRRSKQIALRRKIWNEKIHLPPPQKLKDCPTCNKSFGDMDDFKKHILTHKPKSEPSEEQSTPNSFKNKTVPKDQIKNTSIKVEKDSDSENDYPDWIEIVCEICYNRFCRKKGLRKHLIKVHKLDLKKVNYYLQKVQHNTASYHTCKTCKKQFYRESRLHSHDCVPAISVICELCKQKLCSKSGLKRHLLTLHKLGESKTDHIMNQLSNYNAKFYKKLEPAGEVAISSSDGRIVVKKKGSRFNILEGERCETCYKIFTNENDSEGHKCISKIEIKCEICKYNAPSKYNLKRHLMRIHKLPLSDAEKAMSEFKCYNERLRLRYPVVGKKKNSLIKSVRPNVKSLTPSKAASFKNATSTKLKTRAKEILLNKGKKLLLSRNDRPKKAPLLHKVSSGSSSSKKSNSSGPLSSKKLNSSGSLSSKKPISSRPSSSKKPSSSRPSSSKKPNSSVSSSSKKLNSSGSSSSKKPKLSNIVKKKEKMKHTSVDSIKKVAAKKLVTKSKNYFGKNASPRLLRSNKK